MLKTLLSFATITALSLGLSTYSAQAAPVIGQAAPEFSGVGIDGESFNLADHKGEIVVLEWTNHLCPFVEKHYNAGNMQTTQEKAKEMGAKWVTIVSSAPGKQGHVTAEEAQKIVDETGAHPDVKILDESGEIGKLYDAQTTPHMFVIDAEGTLAYMGAIDDQPSANPASLEGATNYVLAAVESLKAGEAVETAQTQAYGCGVKYAPQ